ncbi:MAG TPA: TlpA disulfide reductase family protein [Usitatibacter sp.]|nr:TlpA disulfide reductase family protein [Usitatibacter sp.]
MPNRIASLALAGLLCAPPAMRAADDAMVLKAGDVPPASLGVTRDGDAVETRQFAGKVLIVTFWASWCGPCRKELPLLEGVQRVAGKDRVQVVAVNIEERDQFRRVARALESLTLTVTHDYNKASAAAYGVKGIPHMLIIGRDGKVQKVHRGYSEEAVDRIVAEVNAALAS